MTDLHRLDFEALAGPEYAGEWADIHTSRSWGARLRLQDASGQAISTFKLAMLSESISRWSREEPPEASAFEKLDEVLGELLFEACNQWYVSRRRDAEAHKSTANRPPDLVVVGDSPA